MSQDHDALVRAREAFLHWLSGPGRAVARPVVAVGIDPRRGVLLIGVSKDPSKALKREIEKRLGDTPYAVVPASVERHADPAGEARIRPLAGGIQITDRADGEEGSLGLVIFDAHLGQRGFLAAGHTVDQPNAIVGQPDDATDNIVGVVLANGLLDAPFNIDAAFVGINDTIAATPYAVWQEGGPLAITSLTSVPVVGQPCTLQGAVSGTETGQVEFIDFVLPQAPLPAIVGLALATYCSAPGDSGGTVFNPLPAGHEFLGLHQGEVILDGQTYSAFTQVNAIQRVVRIAPPPT